MAQIPKTWAFDFTTGDIATDADGKAQVVTETEAYRQWALLALMTARYRYPVFTRRHGSDLEDVLRQNLAPSVLQSEIIRTITDTLKVNPFTKSVEGFSFARTGNALNVAFTAVLTTGERVPIITQTGVIA